MWNNKIGIIWIILSAHRSFAPKISKNVSTNDPLIIPTKCEDNLRILKKKFQILTKFLREENKNDDPNAISALIQWSPMSLELLTISNGICTYKGSAEIWQSAYKYICTNNCCFRG